MRTEAVSEVWMMSSSSNADAMVIAALSNYARKSVRENRVNQSGSVALSAEEVRGPP